MDAATPTRIAPAMRRILLIATLFALGPAAAQAAWYDSNWSQRKAITIDSTKVGSGPHTDFPVLVSITDSDLETKAQSDADDILFTASDGTTKLAHEIESWTSGTGTLVAWVRIPSLPSSADTVIYMYYGNGTAANQQDVTGTWSSSFRAVLHLNGAVGDSTSYNNDGTDNGTTSATGKIASGREFVASSGPDNITINGLMGSPASVTLSVWMRFDSSDTDGAEIISLGDHVTIRGYQSGAGLFGFAYNGSGWPATLSGNDYRGTGWHYVAYTFDDGGNVQVVYVDGADVATTNHSSSVSYSGLGANTVLGAHGNGSTSYDFDGILDEVRVSSAPRSAGWLSTEYNNQNSPSTFYSVAAEETVPRLSGTVFEDVNYAGGAGRSDLDSSGVARSGARVELYDSSGDFITSTTTDTNGAYSFNVSASTSYTIRAVNGTVTSSLDGAGLVPVQTYRTWMDSGSLLAATDRVGGEDPTKTDAGNGSTTLDALTTTSTTAQSITYVTVDSSSISGIDFGFNFNTVVNTNDSGQGSLRQLITNSNGLSGTQTSVFMISDGAAHPGLRSGIANQLTGGVAVITVSSALPSITGTLTLDGTSQTTHVGNTNSGTLGTGGTVGADDLALSTVNRPEIEIVGSNGLARGLDIQANDCTIQGIAIHGFGANYNEGDIAAGNVSGLTITQNVIGATATSFSAPGAATGGTGVYTGTLTGGSMTNNLIGFTGYSGIHLNSSSASSVTVQNNEIRGCGIAHSGYGGVDLLGSSHTVSGNLFVANKGQGVELFSTAGGAITLLNNTVTGNGIGNASTWETSGLRLNNSNNTIDRNRIHANYGAGLLIGASGSGNRITRNSIYANGTIMSAGGGGATGQIGIDLLSADDNSNSGTTPYYTLNDDGDGDTGGNGLRNYPVVDTATIVGSNLELTGWVGAAGATIEFFVADNDPSGFGEGELFIVSLVEGSGSDTDATTGSYSSDVNCMDQGAESNVNRFKFTIAKPGIVSVGTKLTATATDGSNNTSEFSGVVTVHDNFPDFSVVKSSQIVSDPYNASTNPKAIPGGVALYTVTVTNTDPGTSDDDTFVFTDPIPAGTALYVGDRGGAGSGPVTFSDGATSAGLTYTFTSLSSTADSLSFSNDEGASWSYNPTPDADGYDANVTHLRISPTGSFTGASCGDNPSLSLQFQVRVE